MFSLDFNYRFCSLRDEIVVLFFYVEVIQFARGDSRLFRSFTMSHILYDGADIDMDRSCKGYTMFSSLNVYGLVSNDWL